MERSICRADVLSCVKKATAPSEPEHRVTIKAVYRSGGDRLSKMEAPPLFGAMRVPIANGMVFLEPWDQGSFGISYAIY